MAFTLICHACGQKLTLFDIDVKKRKGSVRCTRCGARVSYELDKRKIQQSGFWSEEESTFDPRVRERVVRQLERNAGRKEAPLPPKKAPEPSHAHDFGDNPFSAKPGFAHFDMRTGMAVTSEDAASPSPAPTPKSRMVSAQKKEEKEGYAAFKSGLASGRRRTIKAPERPVTVIKKEPVQTEKKFTPPPRIVTRTAHRNMSLVRQAQHARKPAEPMHLNPVRSLWQKIRDFFSFTKNS